MHLKGYIQYPDVNVVLKMIPCCCSPDKEAVVSACISGKGITMNLATFIPKI